MITKLRYDLVKYRQQYELVDFESYKLLYESLESLDIRLMNHDESLVQLLPTYEKMFWRPSDKNISDYVDKKCRILSTVVVHQAVHSLVAMRFGRKISRDPGLTLVSEAFATAINVYFSFLIFKTLAQLSATEAFKAYYPKKRAPAFSKRRFAHEYNEFEKDPVGFTHRIATEIWNLYQMFFYIDSFPENRQMEKLNILKRHIEKMDFPWLAVRMDVENNFLFTKANCAPRMTRAQRHRAEKFLHETFEDVDFMAEVISRLGSA